MRSRIQRSGATVKALQSRLQYAYRKDDVRLVRRITVLRDLLVHHVPVSVVCKRWGLSPSCRYDWQKACMVRGMDSLLYRHSGGRPAKLPEDYAVLSRTVRAHMELSTDFLAAFPEVEPSLPAPKAKRQRQGAKRARRRRTLERGVDTAFGVRYLLFLQ